MNHDEFQASLVNEEPPHGLSAPLLALWWDAKQDWSRSHALVDELETTDGMAVHAYLHRKDGQASNADYWYQRAGRKFNRPTVEEEWQALVEGLLYSTGSVIYAARLESQFPAAAFTFETFVGLCLSRCSSAVRALHCAKLSHNANFSPLLTSFQNIVWNSCPIGDALWSRAA